MKFAREEIKEHMQSIGRVKRHASAAIISIAAYVIVNALVSPKVYAAVGIDTKRALAEVKSNQHRKSLMRNASAGLMEFLDDAGLLTRTSTALYKRVHMI